MKANKSAEIADFYARKQAQVLAETTPEAASISPTWAFIIGVGITVFIAVWLTKKVYQCPNCHYSNDWDHVASVTEEAPYCPYCGTHSEVDGTKFERLGRRLRTTRGDDDE